MLNNMRISKKIILGMLPMIILLLAYLGYSSFKLIEANTQLSSLKGHINQQASFGTSLFLLNNISRREQLNKEYLVTAKPQTQEIIGLLEEDFKLLTTELAKKPDNREMVEEVTALERQYADILKTKLWVNSDQLNAILHEYNQDAGPELEDIAITVRDVGIQRNSLQITDIGSRLSASALSARAYFNQFIVNNSETSLQRAHLELLATKSALADYTFAMQDDPKLNYAALFLYVARIEGIFADAETYMKNVTQYRAEAETMSNFIIKNMLSNQIYQWRGLDQQTGDILAFMTSYKVQSIVVLLVSIAIGVAILFWISRQIVNSLNILLARVSEISQGEGDLTKRIEVQGRDETGLLAESLNHFIDSIHNIIKSAQMSSSGMIDNSAKTLALATESSEQLKEQQAKNEFIAIAIEQLAEASNEVASSSSTSSNAVESTFDALQRGSGIVDKSVSSIRLLNQEMQMTSKVTEDLARESEEINKVLSVIKTMAEQTNLLALNAAIEAARAGEAGRGFAVVADEVRTLANRTQDSANEIEESITRLQAESQKVVQSVALCHEHAAAGAETSDQTQDIFNQVRLSVEEMQAMSVSIAAAAEEQSQVTDKIKLDIENVFSFSKNIAESASNSQKTSQESSQSAESLNNLLRKFAV